MKFLNVRNVISALLIAVLICLPFMASEIQTYLATEVLIYALFAMGFNVLFGYTGLLPFGFAALFGFAAYVTALICRHYSGIPLPVTLIIAALSGSVAGLCIGFFCARLSGAYFALTTVAFQMFLFAVALKWRSVTGGDDGMTVARGDFTLGGLVAIPLMNTVNFYLFTLIVVGTAVLLCYLFLKTPLGNSLICVRENDIKASFLGYNVFLIRLIAFSASGVLAGLAGGLFALFQEFVATTCIDLNMGLVPVLMTVIGGSGFFIGPAVGAAFYVIVQNWLSSLTGYWMLIFGTIFIITVLYAGDGLIGLVIKPYRIWKTRQSGKRIY